MWLTVVLDEAGSRAEALQLSTEGWTSWLPVPDDECLMVPEQLDEDGVAMILGSASALFGVSLSHALGHVFTRGREVAFQVTVQDLCDAAA